MPCRFYNVGCGTSTTIISPCLCLPNYPTVHSIPRLENLQGSEIVHNAKAFLKLIFPVMYHRRDIGHKNCASSETLETIGVHILQRTRHGLYLSLRSKPFLLLKDKDVDLTLTFCRNQNDFGTISPPCRTIP